LSRGSKGRAGPIVGVLNRHRHREIHRLDIAAVGCSVERERLAGWGLGIVGPARPSRGLRLRCGP
jgi:hypothetical protein